MATDANEVWTFQFVAEPGNIPAEVRYRQLLKHALRTHGLRCISVSSVPCSRCVHDRVLILSLADKLAIASAVLGRAAQRLDPKQRKALAGELRAVRKELDGERRRVG